MVVIVTVMVRSDGVRRSSLPTDHEVATIVVVVVEVRLRQVSDDFHSRRTRRDTSEWVASAKD